MTDPSRRSRGRPLTLIIGASALTVVTISLTVAVQTLFLSPVDQAPTRAPLTATARPGAIADTLRVRATSRRSTLRTVQNERQGIVTRISGDPTAALASGKELYEVDLEPVFGAPGGVPAFREMSQGMTGPDIEQLQEYLKAASFYGGVIDGKFEKLTEQAVVAWQKSTKLEPDGIVDLGCLVFLGEESGPLSAATPSLRVGQRVTGGEDAVTVLSSEPRFSALLTAGQSERIPPHAAARLTIGRRTAQATTGLPRAASDGTVSLPLEPAGARPICESWCGDVPSDGLQVFPTDILLQPETTGILVPTATLRTSSDGSVHVVTPSGRRLPVEVMATSGGQSVVSGVPDGTKVLLGEPARS